MKLRQLKLNKCSLCHENIDKENVILLGNFNNEKVCFHSCCDHCFTDYLQYFDKHNQKLFCPECRIGDLKFTIKCQTNHSIVSIITRKDPEKDCLICDTNSCLTCMMCRYKTICFNCTQ